MKFILIFVVFAITILSCSNNHNESDASGAFETDETVISADASGTIQQLNIEEGQLLKAGECIGYIDSTQLYLKKKQLEAQIKTTLSQLPDISAQLASLNVQLKSAEKEQNRISNMVAAGATSLKQLDDANTRVEDIHKQIEAQQSTLDITTKNIAQQALPLKVQIEQINDQLSKCRIINPLNGSVLVRYVKQFEMATPGKPLYKIADLSSLVLRAYINGNQLSSIKLNQKVKVFVDNGLKTYKEYSGNLTWISDKAEFTPKTILTKDERADLVYAVKIVVINDGLLKIGMYGEIKL
jgi:HlyD family secretion protein